MSIQQLYEQIHERFSSTELVELCFSLSIKFYELITTSKSESIINIIEYLCRYNEDDEGLKSLIGYCEKVRPAIKWQKNVECLDSSLKPVAILGPNLNEAILADLVRPQRIVAYKSLWSLFEPLAKYAPPGPFTYQSAVTLSIKLRQWYFQDGGGMFLSETSRREYFGIQKSISKHFLPENSNQNDLDSLLNEDKFKLLRLQSSMLRASLARDIGISRSTFDAGNKQLVLDQENVLTFD